MGNTNALTFIFREVFIVSKGHLEHYDLIEGIILLERLKLMPNPFVITKFNHQELKQLLSQSGCSNWDFSAR